MRILIDAHMAGERESGNERYVLNLVRALHDLELPAEFLVAVTDPSPFDGIITESQRWQFVRVSSSPWRRLFIELPGLAKRRSLSLVHVTYAGPLFCSCPVVSTIHDVSYRPHPEWFSYRDRLVLRGGIGMTLSRGASVITISQHSKVEIAKYYRLLPERIDVTPVAADPRFRVLAPDALRRDRFLQLGVRSPYVLAVGNLQPRKNLARLVGAYAQLRQAGEIPHQLVLAGKAQWNESNVYEAVRRAGIEKDVLFTGYVSEDDLVGLYNGADAFVYPSLYEGFGLPVVEAMACGVPVVTSKTTSIPEVAGDAALLVDPLDTDELAFAIRRVLLDRILNRELREKGMRQSAAFSWEQTARLTWDHYCRVGKGGGT